MSANLLSLAQEALGGDFARLAGQFIGESVPSTRSALSSLLPAVLGGVAQKGATPEGASSLLSLVNGSNLDTSILDNVAGLFGTGNGTMSALMKLGTSTLVPVKKGLPAGTDYLESESDYIIQAYQVAYYFGQGFYEAGLTGAYDAFDFRFSFAGGDYYQGTVYAAPGSRYYVGWQMQATDEHQQSGLYTITAMRWDGDAARYGQVMVHSYFDQESSRTYVPVHRDQAVGQADPTNGSPVNFTVVFKEPVTGFATGDVVLSGTAGATTATVTGSGTTYNVAVSGMSDGFEETAPRGTCVIECGAGSAIPTVRLTSERAAASLGGTLVRINMLEPGTPPGHVGICMGALDALTRIDSLIGRST